MIVLDAFASKQSCVEVTGQKPQKKKPRMDWRFIAALYNIALFLQNNRKQRESTQKLLCDLLFACENIVFAT